MSGGTLGLFYVDQNVVVDVIWLYFRSDILSERAERDEQIIA